MSTDRAELSADDVAAMLGSKYRFREENLRIRAEMYFTCLHALGADAVRTQYAFAMFMDAHAKMQREGS